MIHTLSLRRRLRLVVLASTLAGMHFGLAGVASAASSVFIDLPRQQAVVASDFHLGGWAIDWAARATTGVMTIHVWAYPSGGGDPVFLGVPQRGNRPDVAAAYGQNFLGTGFGLNVRGLAPGNYLVAIFPFSDIRGAFDYDSAVTLAITVARAKPAPPPLPPAPKPEPAPTPAPGPASPTSTSLKVLDWNIQHGVGTDGVYNIDRIAAAIARASPDVVSLNEVERYTGWGNEDQPARFAALLKSKTGQTWYYNFATRTGRSEGQGNLLLSVYPIDVNADYLLSYERSVAHVQIIVNGRRISLFSTHLDDDSSAQRLTQMRELNGWSDNFPQSTIVAGDFNAWPGATEIRTMTALFLDTWAVARAAGTSVAYAGNEAGNTRNSRIDYVWLSKGTSALSIRSSQVFDLRDSSGVMPSDHRPVMTTFDVR